MYSSTQTEITHCEEELDQSVVILTTENIKSSVWGIYMPSDQVKIERKELRKESEFILAVFIKILGFHQRC